MKINVLGGTGQLGSRIVEALLQAGASPQHLTVSRRNASMARRFADRGIEVRHADLDRPETLEPAFAGTDVLMLIPSMADVEHRILQHERILASAASTSVGRIVLSSFSAARTDSLFLIAPFYGKGVPERGLVTATSDSLFPVPQVAIATAAAGNRSLPAPARGGPGGAWPGPTGATGRTVCPLGYQSRELAWSARRSYSCATWTEAWVQTRIAKG